ncbi:hypothetical protein LCGC14_2555130 [marine sediment metagenome]|uniref:Uncharacterized protein n=1 Tax=marine sediment metagenome TaxID=412755 RepID=A0A0F9B9M1_9ZZZZ
MFPVSLFGECLVEPDEIKSGVKNILAKVTKTPDQSAIEIDFIDANSKLIKFIQEIEECQRYSRDFEIKNYHFSRWGEKSDKYFTYISYMRYLKLQISAVIESFELGELRSMGFKISMWREQAEEFYAKEI